jgi:hypothetical protein
VASVRRGIDAQRVGYSPNVDFVLFTPFTPYIPRRPLQSDTERLAYQGTVFGTLTIMQIPSRDWETRMSIEATAVIKKETEVDLKKPEDKVHRTSLSVLNRGGKEYGLPRYFTEFRDIAVLLKREAGVRHEQLHERFAAYEKDSMRWGSVGENDGREEGCVNVRARCRVSFYSIVQPHCLFHR